MIQVELAGAGLYKAKRSLPTCNISARIGHECHDRSRNLFRSSSSVRRDEGLDLGQCSSEGAVQVYPNELSWNICSRGQPEEEASSQTWLK